MRRFVWLSLSAVLIALIVWRTRPWEALELAGGVWILPLIGALALNVVVIGAWAVRSWALLGAVGHAVGLRPLIPIVSFANTINNLTPASAGEAVRVVIMSRRHGVPYAPATATIVTERVFALWIMGATALAAAAIGLGDLAPAGMAAVVLGTVALVLTPWALLRTGLRPAQWIAGLVARGARPDSRRRRLAVFLVETERSMVPLMTEPRHVGQFFTATAVVFVAYALQLWLVLASLDTLVPITVAWAAFGLGTIAGVLSALPFGLGAADAVMTVILVAAGVDASTAGAAVLLLRATTTLPLGIIGAASWMRLAGPRESRPADTKPA